MNARAFWTTTRQPATPAEVDKVLAEIQQHTPFQAATPSTTSAGRVRVSAGDDQSAAQRFRRQAEDMREVRRIAHAIAEGACS